MADKMFSHSEFEKELRKGMEDHKVTEGTAPLDAAGLARNLSSVIGNSETKDTMAIYQLKDTPETRDFRFESLDHLEKRGMSVNRAHYDLMYTAPLASKDTLDSIYERFNVAHPSDFTGHSPSVSDIIVLKQNDITTAHYVDALGFKELPNFLPEKKVYMASVETAREKGELPAYRESLKLNAECAKSIEKAINNSHDGQYSYNLSAALKEVTEQYGTERAHVVLANTVDYKDYDGRFSHTNKQWAQGVKLPDLPKDRRSGFVCEAHPAILDGFINRARKQAQEIQKKPSFADQLKVTPQPAKVSAARNKEATRDDKGR